MDAAGPDPARPQSHNAPTSAETGAGTGAGTGPGARRIALPPSRPGDTGRPGVHGLPAVHQLGVPPVVAASAACRSSPVSRAR